MALTRSDVQKVIKALASEELSYWRDNPNEWFTHCLISSHLPTKPFDLAVMWDGYHWNFVRCLAQASMWEDMKRYMDTMGETHLRVVMETIIQKASPRLYAQYMHGKQKTTGGTPF